MSTVGTKKSFSLASFAAKTQTVQEIRKPEAALVDKRDIFVVDLSSHVDLNRLDRHVRSLYENLLKRLDEITDQHLNLLGTDLETEEEMVLAENHRISLEAEISQLEFQLGNYERYFEDSKPLLDVFDALVPQKTCRVVGGDETFVSNENHDEFRYVITEFVKIAMRFSKQIKVVTRNISIEDCHCGSTPFISDNKVICPGCGKESKLKESSFSSTKSAKSDYYRSETFEEYFDEAQGRRKKPIPPEIYQAIQTHCNKYSIQVAKLSKSDIFGILKTYKFSEYYKSLNLICHVLIGSPLPDIQQYRQACLERHRLIEQEYMEMRKTENRSNFLYAWYVLRVCLYLEGYDAKAEDFATLTTREAAIDHNSFMIKICARIREKQKTDSSIKGNWEFDGLR